MQWPTTVDILLQKDLSVPFHDDVCVTLEERICTHVEVLVTADSVGIVVDCAHQMTLLDVQVFELVTFLDLVELVRDDLLEAHSLVVEKGDQCLVIAAIGERVIVGAPVLVHVQFLRHVLTRVSTLNGKVEGHIFEIEVGCDVKRCAAQVVLLRQKLQDVIFVELLVDLPEAIDDVGQLAPVHHREDACAVAKFFRPQTDCLIHLLVLVLRNHLTILPYKSRF